MSTLDLREESEERGTIYDDMSIEEIVRKLQDVDLQSKILESQATEMKKVLTQKMIDQDLDRAETDVATITRAQRKSYSYSATVDEMNDQLKRLKKEEEENGRAEPKYTDYLTIRYK